MRRALLPLGFALAALLTTIAIKGQAPAAIRADQVKALLGKPVTVEDIVVQISREPQSGFTYLNFGAAFPKQVFRAIIPDTIEKFVDAAALRLPARVRVRGVAQLGRQGWIEIMCLAPTQITVLPPEVSVDTPRVNAAGAVVGGLTPAAPVVHPVPTLPNGTQTCCRTCANGKPCGDSCIAQSATCQQPAGCACAPR